MRTIGRREESTHRSIGDLTSAPDRSASTGSSPGSIPSRSACEAAAYRPMRVGTIGNRAGGSFGVGGSFPEWKSNLHVSYAWRDLTLGATWRYIDAMTDSDPEQSRSRVPRRESQLLRLERELRVRVRIPGWAASSDRHREPDGQGSAHLPEPGSGQHGPVPVRRLRPPLLREPPVRLLRKSSQSRFSRIISSDGGPPTAAAGRSPLGARLELQHLGMGLETRRLR